MPIYANEMGYLQHGYPVLDDRCIILAASSADDQPLGMTEIAIGRYT